MIRSIAIAFTLLLATAEAGAMQAPRAGDAVGSFSLLAVTQNSEERPPGPATLEEAIEIAVNRFGGRAVSADTVERDGQRVHEIRLLDEDDENSVRTVRIDPNTGEIIPPRRR